jgi:putative transposase
MKTSRFSNEQIAMALRQVEAGTPVEEICRKLEISQAATFDSFEKADALMRLCRKAPDLFQQQTFDEQARLLKFIESNATFDGKTLTAEYKKPFDTLVEGLKGTTGGADETRTSALSPDQAASVESSAE